MSTMKNIEQVISQIMHDTDTYKPDLYCAEDVFQELIKRPDCQIHPIQKNTIVMLPNVYWSLDPKLTVPNIVAHTHRGELILEYLDLVSHYIFEEKGSIDEVQQMVQEFIKNKNK